MDYGTLSGRAVVVRVRDGKELGSGVFDYPHAVVTDALPADLRTSAGDGAARLPGEWALQVPNDYRDVLRHAVPAAIADAGIDPAAVVGIATDFTACTMVPVKADGTPLNELDGFANRPHAYVKLWRHHAAQPQADRINALAAERGETWLPRYGGLISSEWEFAKGLQLLEEDPEAYAAMDHWVEAADWIVWQLCGQLRPQRLHRRLQGHLPGRPLPVRGIPGRAEPGLQGLRQHQTGAHHRPARRRRRLPHGRGRRTGPACRRASPSRWATWTPTSPLPAARAVEPGQLVAIMGTSTCHVMNGTELHEVPGMCGVVDGGIVDGLWGYEAGQSGVGDIFGWFTRNGVPPEYHQAAPTAGLGIHEYLTELASRQAIGEHGLIALDWHSGNRSVLVDHELSGVVVGQTLATKPEDTYRALLEATAFGTRTIVDAFRDSGVPVKEFIVAGGLLKNKLLMQIYADITGLQLSTIGSTQGPALGSAIHAAVAAGEYAGHPRGRGRHGLRTRRASTRPSRKTWPPTRNCSRNTGRSTTTSAAAPTT